VPDATSFGALDWAVLAGYFIGITSFGLWLSRKTRTSGSYFLGERKLPWWMMVGQAFSTGTHAGATAIWSRRALYLKGLSLPTTSAALMKGISCRPLLSGQGPTSYQPRATLRVRARLDSVAGQRPASSPMNRAFSAAGCFWLPHPGRRYALN
jgi:hypothetical protein